MTRLIKTILLMFLLAYWNGGSCMAQASPGWSFWGTADGMPESYTSSIAVIGSRVWIKHGSVVGMNLLDGYSLSELPDVGQIGPIQASPDGTPWSWNGARLNRFYRSRWDSFQVDSVTGTGALSSDSEQHWIFKSNRDPHLQSRIWVVGLDADHALILLPDRILAFEAIGKTTSVVLSSRDSNLGSFISMRRQLSGEISITGQKGMGKLNSAGSAWKETARPPTGYSHFDEPFEGEQGEVFVTAVNAANGKAVLRLGGDLWSLVYKGGSNTLRGWRGEEKTVWIQDGNLIFRLTTAGTKIPVSHVGPLSGVILSIQPEGNQQFWISTSQGLAVYLPALWRTPPEAQIIDDVVNAIIEDKQGRVWFLSPHVLICLDGQHWEFFPLPAQETAWTYISEGLASLPDETIAIRTTSSDLLTFDPHNRQFHTIKHPTGRDIGLTLPGPDGLLLVQTISRASPAGLVLDLFDGHTFRPLLNSESSGRSNDLRALTVGANGEIWAGGSNSFGVYKNGSFSKVGPSTGFHDSGVFCLKRIGNRILAGGREGLYDYDGQTWRRVLRGLDRVRNISTGRDGSIWIASGTGIHRIKADGVISHGTREGLPSDVVYRVFEDSRGRIWAGTTRGLALLHPDADQDPPTTFINPEQNARETPPGGRVRMVFSGMDKWKFTPSERLLFSWRVDGETWSAFNGETSVSLDAVTPGEHLFEVRAMDRNGNIDTHPPSYRFLILPVWYHSRGVLYMVCFPVLSISILFWFVLSNRRLLSRKKLLESDRGEVLEMIARREPLECILQRVLEVIAVNQRGAIGAALEYGDVVFQFLAFSAPSVRLTHARGRWTTGEENGHRELGFWGLENGPTIPIQSGSQERLGSMVALFPERSRESAAGMATLEALTGLASLAIENARLHDQLDHLAHHDVLTGLPNRLLFESELQAAVQEAKDTSGSFGLLFLDIDRFKQINDTLGHGAGDSVLGQVAARLMRSIPEGAMAARSGGDEFTVVLRRQSRRSDVEEAVLGILLALRAPLTVGNRDLWPNASIGISMFPRDGHDAVTLQQHADLALYGAKSRGRNCYEFFSSEVVDAVGVSPPEKRPELRLEPQ